MGGLLCPVHSPGGELQNASMSTRQMLLPATLTLCPASLTPCPAPLPNLPDHAGSLAPCKLHARQLHTWLCPALPPPVQIMLAVTQQGKRPPVPNLYEAAQVRCVGTKQRLASS